MSVAQTEATLKAYAELLIQRGACGAYLAPEVALSVMGTGLVASGPEAVEQLIRYLHEQAFDAQAELLNTLTADGRVALEANFIGTHTGQFMGMPATGRRVDVPYAVFYSLQGAQITALRIYPPLEALMRQLGAGEAVETAA